MEEKFEGSAMPDNAAIVKGSDAEIMDRINAVNRRHFGQDERQEMWNACMDRQPA